MDGISCIPRKKKNPGRSAGLLRGYGDEVLFILLGVSHSLVKSLFHEAIEQGPAELHRIGKLIESLEELKFGRGMRAVFSKTLREVVDKFFRSIIHRSLVLL
ncbi:MAG: hypothetical protein AAB449_00150 [Patescibacteria group bacterium]